MGLDNNQIAKLKTMKHAAKSALKYFRDIKPINSLNNPFVNKTTKRTVAFEGYRKDQGAKGSDNVMQSFEDASYHQVGNCEEKGRIVYASLLSNPLLQNKGIYISLCSSKEFGYDHVFVVLSDVSISDRVNLRALGTDTMIVDGWTEDWYFPHMSWTSAKWYGISNLPNPRQLYVRRQIVSHDFKPKYVPMTAPSGAPVHNRSKGNIQPAYQGSNKDFNAIGNMKREFDEFDRVIAKGQAPFQLKAAQQQAGSASSAQIGPATGKERLAFVWVSDADQWSPSQDYRNWNPSSIPSQSAANWSPSSNINKPIPPFGTFIKSK